MNLEQSQWLSSSGKARTEIVMHEPDSIWKTNKFGELVWTENQYIKFGPTDKTKDASQETVPYLNNVPLIDRLTLLSGAGLYFKSIAGYGGIVSPLLISYNYEPYINPID